MLRAPQIKLWQESTKKFTTDSDVLKDVAAKISGMPTRAAIFELNSTEAPSTLSKFYSVTSSGETLPAAPHLALQPNYRPSIGALVVGVGSDAATTDYPAVAEVAYSDPDNGGHMATQCTGTLIAPDAILTAAHCFCLLVGKTDASSCSRASYQHGANRNAKATDRQYFSVFFQDIGAVPVQSILIDPNFNGIHADLAVVKLSKNITRIRTAPIYSGSVIPAGNYGFIVGFGFRSVQHGHGIALKPNSTGLKFWGRVQLGVCPASIQTGDEICWNFKISAGTENTSGSTCHATLEVRYSCS